MKKFSYKSPTTLKDACKLLGNNWYEALPYAGGTDLLGLMKRGIENPEKLINLKSITGYDKIIHKPGSGLTIGAMVTVAEIAENAIVNEKYPVLAQAAKEVASPQLRNVGTIGGNICQRPRCWYYRGDFNCLRKNGDICYAIEGQSKYHCIVGGGPCFIVHPSDIAVALSSLNALIKISNGKKSRQIPIDQFYVLPEQNILRENILQPGEILVEVAVPDISQNTCSGYIKFKERGTWDFAVVSVAAVIQLESDKITDGKIVFGGVAPKPWVDAKLNAELKGLTVEKENIKNFAAKALSMAEPLAHNKYKMMLAPTLIKRLLLSLCQ